MARRRIWVSGRGGLRRLGGGEYKILDFGFDAFLFSVFWYAASYLDLFLSFLRLFLSLCLLILVFLFLRVLDIALLINPCAVKSVIIAILFPVPSAFVLFTVLFIVLLRVI